MPVTVTTGEVDVATEEVGEFPLALAEAAILVRCLLEAGKCSLAAEWAHGAASVGVAATGTAAHGVASAGLATTGTAGIGVVAGIITMVMTSFSSGISVFRGGGAHILGVGATLTDIMIIPIRTTTMAMDTSMVTLAMVMGRPAMITETATRMEIPTTAAITAARAMEMTTRLEVPATATITAARATEMATRLEVPTTAAITAARAMEMTIPPIQEWPSCNADLRGLGIILARPMESWGLQPGKQFTLSSATMPNR
jgi:hypothetical protein